MASSSSISTPLVVEVKDRTHPIFKKHPYKNMEDDSVGDYSFIPCGVLNVDNIQVYIHCEIKETYTKDYWHCMKIALMKYNVVIDVNSNW